MYRYVSRVNSSIYFARYLLSFYRTLFHFLLLAFNDLLNRLLHFAWVVDNANVLWLRASVCLSAATCPHHCTDPGVYWGSGRGWPPYVTGGHYIFSCGFFLLSFFLFSSSNLSRRRLDVYLTSTPGVALLLSANLECRSETCCRRLTVNTGRKNRHLGTIAQLCRAISSQLKAGIDNRKKLVKQQYILHMSS